MLLLAASMVGGSRATDLMGIRLDQTLAEGLEGRLLRAFLLAIGVGLTDQ